MIFGFHSSELIKWLEPLEKLRFEIGSIPSLIAYIKQVQMPLLNVMAFSQLLNILLMDL